MEWTNHGGSFSATDKHGVEWSVAWDSGWDAWILESWTREQGFRWVNEFETHTKAMNAADGFEVA